MRGKIRPIGFWWHGLLAVIPALALAQPPLRLKARSSEQTAVVAASQLQAGKRRDPARMHMIFQFAQPPGQPERDALRNAGIRVLQHVPENAILVSVPAAGALAGPEQSGLVLERIEVLTPQDKISPVLPLAADSDGGLNVVVEFYPDVSEGDALAILDQEGVRVRNHPDLAPGHFLIQAGPDAVLELAAWDEVAYVFPASRELEGGLPVHACAGAVTENGSAGQYVARIGEGWDGPGQGRADLLYSLRKLPASLPPDAVRQEILRALAQWAKYAQINFSPGGSATSKKHLDFLWARGNHGDPFPFDGPGRMLAHTFYPSPPNPEPLAGDLHFDEEENWQIGGGVDVFSVVLHELGHALGLGHSDRPDSVMYPYYKRNADLTEEDISAIRQLYGTRVPSSDTNSPDEPTAPPSDPPAGAPSDPPAKPPAEPPSQPPSSPGGSTPSQPAAPPSGGADRIAPQLRISWPSGAATLTSSATIHVRGTATDNTAVTQVRWKTNTGKSGLAAGTLEWDAGPVALALGNNTITITAEDAAGNRVSRSTLVVRR